jgi:hypothetical protein
MKSILILAGLCALLCGCQGVKQEEYYWAHFGPYPTNYDAMITEWVSTNFSSPRGLNISAPVRVRFPHDANPFEKSKKVYGWSSGVSFEPKGEFDGYTSRKYYLLYMREGQIVATDPHTQEQPRTRGIAQTRYFQ